MQLTEKIYNTLFEEILKGKYSLGGKIPTEFETAERFNASRITVRRAYAILEQNGIIIRRKRCGTVVSEKFTGSTAPIGTIAAVMPLADEFARDFLRTLCREAAKEKILTVIEPDAGTGKALSDCVLRLVSAGVRNMIFWLQDPDCDRELFCRLRVLGVNMVFFDRILPSDKFADYVGLDNKAAIKGLIEKALEMNCTRFIFAGAGNLRYDSNQERRRCFIKECNNRQLNNDIIEICRSEKCDPAQEPALKALLAGNGEKTAVICVNDTIALEAVNISSDNCQIFSIDGTPEALEKGVISCLQPMEKMAEKCLLLLKKQQDLGPKWVASEYRVKGDILRKC